MRKRVAAVVGPEIGNEPAARWLYENKLDALLLAPGELGLMNWREAYAKGYRIKHVCITDEKEKPPLTPWFPAHIKPVREGMYQVHSYSHVLGRTVFSFRYWNGRIWIAQTGQSLVSGTPWRGLTQPCEE